MDKASVAYGIPDPIRWTFKRPIPAAHFGCWLRVNAAPPDFDGSIHFCIESHPWQAEPPPDSTVWQPLGLDRQLVGRFEHFVEACAWLKGLLHGSAWLQEFALTPRIVITRRGIETFAKMLDLDPIEGERLFREMLVKDIGSGGLTISILDPPAGKDDHDSSGPQDWKPNRGH